MKGAFVYLLALLGLVKMAIVSGHHIRARAYNGSLQTNQKFRRAFLESAHVVISKKKPLSVDDAKKLKELTQKKNVFFIQASSSSTNIFHEQNENNRNKVHVITGYVEGISEGHPISVAVGARYSNYFESFETKDLTKHDNKFRFVLKPGYYYLRLYGPSYMVPSAVKISIPCRTKECPFINESYSNKITVAKFKDNPSLFYYSWERQSNSPVPAETINTIHKDEAAWSHGNRLPSENLKMDSSGAAAAIRIGYGIELCGDWGSEYSERLLDVLTEFPHIAEAKITNNNKNENGRKLQKWVLTDEPLGATDMEVEVHSNPDSKYSRTIHVSKGAFSFSTKQVHMEAANGKYYSRRLEKVLIRAFATSVNNFLKEYFRQKHDVTLLDPVYDSDRISMLTGYSHEDYQSWFQNVEELIELATSWAEYPKGFHKVNGLKFLVRRKNGMKHPQYPTAPAVAFPAGPNTASFIEYMESAFNNYYDISHLHLHEVGHFIAKNMVKAELFQEWIRLGEWYEEPRSASKWATRAETKFVSAYAHDKTPGEDFAESIAAFVLNPRKLNSRAPEKYNWMKKTVFGGGFYVTHGRHTFQVLNLGNEILTYPGKVKKVTAKVVGSPLENKKVYLNVYLYRQKNSDEGCAMYMAMRLVSEQMTYRDVILYPKNKSVQCAHDFSAEMEFNTSEARGKWVATSIHAYGKNDIQRYMGLGSFLYYFYINNFNEDIEAPIPLIESARVLTYDGRGDEDSLLRLSIFVAEDTSLKTAGGSYVAFAANANDSYSYSSYTYKKYADKLDLTELVQDSFLTDIKTNGFRKVSPQACKPYTDLDMSKLNCFQLMHPVAVPSLCIANEKYYFRHITLFDLAGNTASVNVTDRRFSANLNPRSRRDYNDPQVRGVHVSSTPVNAQPDGETDVRVRFTIYDDLSGVEAISVVLRDPHGGKHSSYVPDHLIPPAGQSRTIDYLIRLPRGSMSGTWLLDEIKATDKCKNESRNVYSYSVYVAGEN